MKLIDDLRQRHLEAFEGEYIPYLKTVDGETTGDRVLYGQVVRMAIRSGWFGDANEDDVADMDWKEVKRLADSVNERYFEVITLDPNS